MIRRFAYYLLLPIAPFLGWGPITHLYLHKKAVDELGDNGPEGVLERDEDKDLFISAGNITDLIKANQLRYRERFYEYTHNTIPTKFEGKPIFGESLWRENLKRGRRDGMTYSLGWICHQVSDQFPHRYPTNGYEGFVNSRKFFGKYYPVDEDDYSMPVKNLRNDLISVDHWLTEIFADLLCICEEPEFLRKLKIDLDFGDYPEIEEVSAKVIEEYHDLLYPAVKYFIPLKSQVMTRVYRYYHILIRAFIDMYFHFYDTLGPERIKRIVEEYEPLNELPKMFEFSMKAIHKAIEQPVGSWTPGEYIGPDTREIKYSVYSYETYDGPERYDFGFRRGVIPWFSGLFSNSRMLNEMGMKMSDRMSTWRFVKPVMDLAKRRKRSGTTMTAFFICELDAMENPSIAELIERTAKRFKLTGRTQ